ncbi:MAG: hypothetical protein IT348_01230 [Candidatus Eisenbacteria bacterium]|nr:hypothetical protein [Candidatus Eisenbacteria bacterium]
MSGTDATSAAFDWRRAFTSCACHKDLRWRCGVWCWCISSFLGRRQRRGCEKFTGDGVCLCSWGTQGSAAGQFSSPTGVAVDDAGNIYVADRWSNRIQVFGVAPTVAWRRTWGAVKELRP